MALGAQGTPLSPEMRQELIVAEPSSISPVSTFIIRFWREWSAAGWRWRGRIEHVQSGESTSCLDLEGVLGFMQDRGVMSDNSGERREADA